ncbi:MAG: transporter, Spinster family, sphingosine-phosphate transporter [Acidobacteriota bacterium]|jgi:MFS family permease|nr:transporter, Spinster family, sphingosine-phosphate transporter [Acidobacteriota bacterium]
MNLKDKNAPLLVAPTGTHNRSAVPRYSIYALAILSLVNFLNYIDRQVLPAVATSLLADRSLNLTDADIGLMETSLLLSFTVLAPIFGRLGDRHPRARLMAVAAVLWSIATALTGLVDQLPFVHQTLHLHVPLFNISLTLSGVALALCAVRACVGVGESAYSTITPSLIADYFPPHRRATALGVFQSAIPMGYALGFVVGGLLAHFFGWRAAFMIVGVPGLLTAVLVWRLREPVRGATDAPHQESALQESTLRESVLQESSLADMAASPAEASRVVTETGRGESVLRTAWRILKSRDWLISTAAYTALTAALGAFATWAIVLMVRDKGMSQTSANITLGVVTLLAGAAGTFGGGWVADRFAARRHNAYFLVCAVSTLLGIVPTLLILIADDPRVFIPCTFFAVALLFVSNAPFHAILLESVPVGVRAMAVALNIVIIHGCGDAISRLLVGVLSDSLKEGHLAALSTLARMIGIDAGRQHLTTALLIAPAALAVSTSLFFLGAKMQKQRDAEAV